MSFGVSAGDIITVISLGFTVYERIRECPIEQKELACQIVDFRQLLDVIDIDLHSPRFVQGIEQQRLKCYRLLQRLDEDTSKCTKGHHPNEKLSGRRRRVLKEAKWVFYRRDRFKKSQEELRSQIYHLYFLLQNSSASIYHEISMTLDRVENGTSVATEQWPDLKPIRFIDALDRRREFPFELCEEWEDFQELVKRSFQGSFGRSWVEAGRYEITDEATGMVITADEWNIKIKPGMLISMAMLVEKPSISTKTEIYCPLCDTPRMRSRSGGPQGVRCKKCSTWFQTSSTSSILVLVDVNMSPRNLRHLAGIESKKQSHMVNLEFDISEAKYFRRFHVLEIVKESGELQS